MTTEATILIIDDKSANVFVVEKLLEEEGRKFLSASNGKDGLKIAFHNPIDLIILDVQMPDMDGFEVAQVLKSNKQTKDIPIIFASAERNERHFVMKGFEGGAVDYLLKPLDPDLTKAKVAVLLQIQLQKRELQEKNTSLEKADAQIKKLNADLSKNLQQLESTNKELESFSYSVSHDLRAPLRALIGYAEMLKEDYNDKIDDEGRRMLTIIRENAERMNQLIDDLLEFSRSGKKDLQRTVLDMDKVVRGVVTEVSSNSNGQVNVIVKEMLPAQADFALLQQVWVNLISNAFKYSSKKPSPEVEINSHKQGPEIIYSVKDNGAGFDMQYAPKLFGVFQRLHKPTDFAGTGIGLSIVQRIIIRHGGRVWAEGKVNEGATFYFTLPVE